MFLVTWIEGDKVNYQFVEKQELDFLLKKLDQHVIVQDLIS
ncbi:MAG: hypothetical protein WA113_00740 [Desulfitobacteriaceae bacterium]